MGWITSLDIQGVMVTPWCPGIPVIGPAGDQRGPNEGGTWAVVTRVGAGADLIGRDAFLARLNAFFLHSSRTFWLTLWPSRRWSHTLSLSGKVLSWHSSQWYPDPVLELMCLSREERLPKNVSHAHRKAEWPVSFTCSSSPELIWNNGLQTRQVFGVGPSRLVYSKKLDNRAESRIRGFSVGGSLEES